MELLAVLLTLSACPLAGFVVGYLLSFVLSWWLSLKGANVAAALTWLVAFVAAWTIGSYVYSCLGLDSTSPLAVTGTAIAAVFSLIISTVGVEFGFRAAQRRYPR